MNTQSRFARESSPSPAPPGQGRKPPSEMPKSALYLVVSPGCAPRELSLRCGEEKEVLNRLVRLEMAFSAEDTPEYDSPPAAMLSIRHKDGSGKNNYFLEEGQEFRFGDHVFRLAEIH